MYAGKCYSGREYCGAQMQGSARRGFECVCDRTTLCVQRTAARFRSASCTGRVRTNSNLNLRFAKPHRMRAAARRLCRQRRFYCTDMARMASRGTKVYIYIYIYIYRERERERERYLVKMCEEVLSSGAAGMIKARCCTNRTPSMTSSGVRSTCC